MTTPKQRFVNRPQPKEAPARALEYRPAIRSVPQVRGLLVPILGYLYMRPSSSASDLVAVMRWNTVTDPFNSLVLESPT